MNYLEFGPIEEEFMERLRAVALPEEKYEDSTFWRCAIIGLNILEACPKI